MSRAAALWKTVAAWLAAHAVEVGLALRVAVAGTLTELIAGYLGLVQGYWAVFTAVIVMQVSVGGSLKATLDRFIGTLGGALYGSGIAVAMPHGGTIWLSVALAVALAPLALLAAVDPRFRVAPVTAVIVLLSPTGGQMSPFAFTVDRLLEIGLGSVVALVVSFVVLPAHAHGLLAETTSRLLRLLGEFLALLLEGQTHGLDKAAVLRLQVATRRLLGKLEAAADEAKRERTTFLTGDPDPDPVVRTALRLRNDLIIIARAAMEPLPAPFDRRLGPPLSGLAVAGGRLLDRLADAFAARRPPPPLDDFEAALRAYNAEIAALREEGATRALSPEAVGRLFALGFGLEQLHQNLHDFVARTAEWAGKRPDGP